MTSAAKGRLIAAIALPCLLLNVLRSHIDSFHRTMDVFLLTK